MEKKAKVAAKKPARPAPRKRRAIGRPSAETEGVGREGLIEMTCELLRILPPAQVTRAEVARYANVDPSLIRYYFKDRSALLVAATERLTDRFAKILLDVAKNSGDDPESKLRARVTALMDLIISYPFFHRLFVEELIATGSPEGEKLFRDIALKGVRGYEGIISEGTAKGVLRDVDAGYLFLAIIGMTEFFLGGLPVLKVARGAKLDQKQATEDYREFVIELLLNGLRAQKKSRKS